jgi:hypothetical protein
MVKLGVSAKAGIATRTQKNKSARRMGVDTGAMVPEF